VTRVRSAGPDDAPALARIYAPYVTDGVVSFEAEPPDAAEMARRIATGGDLHPWLVAEEAGAVIGYAYAAPFRTRAAYAWAVETTIYLAGEAQGRGIGGRLYRALLDLLARQGFTQAVGVIALPNDASVRLHERLGFTPAGVNRAVGWKRGRWIDVGVWQRALARPGDPPAPPLRVSAVLDTPAAPAAT
jgi:L-amino acid N-acyltransferase YncA